MLIPSFPNSEEPLVRSDSSCFALFFSTVSVYYAESLAGFLEGGD